MPLLLLRPQPPAPLPLPLVAPALDAETGLLQQPASGEEHNRSEPPLSAHEQPASQPGLHLPPLRRLEGLALLLVTALMWGEHCCVCSVASSIANCVLCHDGSVDFHRTTIPATTSQAPMHPPCG